MSLAVLKLQSFVGFPPSLIIPEYQSTVPELEYSICAARPTPVLFSLRIACAVEVLASIRTVGVPKLVATTLIFEPGLSVPIPIFPFRIVSVIESLPSVTVFDPEPIAPYPKTFSLETPSAEALVSAPMKTEVPDVAFNVEPSVM